MSTTAAQPSLIPTITVHCFLRCGHVVEHHDPDGAHAAMERHYADRHAAWIDSIVGEMT